MMASELENLPAADLEDGEIDSNDVVDEDSIGDNDDRPSKKHSKRDSDGKRKRKSDRSDLTSDMTKSKKAKKAKYNEKSRRRTSSQLHHDDLSELNPHGATAAAPGQLYGYSSEEDDDAATHWSAASGLSEPEDLGVGLHEGRIRASAGGKPNELKKRTVSQKKKKKKEKWCYRPKKVTIAPVRAVPVCTFYMEGRCNKGDKCTFSHSVDRPKRPQLCRFYAIGSCSNGSDCQFMHSEFPCKFHHLFGLCRSGSECRFSHEPLSSEMRAVLDSNAASDSQSESADNTKAKSTVSEGSAKQTATEPQRQKFSLLGSAPQPSLPAGVIPVIQQPSLPLDLPAASPDDADDQELRTRPHQQELPLHQPPQQQSFKPAAFPPRPFPHPGDVENRHQPLHQQPPLPVRPPFQPVIQTLPRHPAPPTSMPPPTRSGGQMQRPAYSGPHPPERPFPSAPRSFAQHQDAPRPLPPPQSTKPSAAAVAAASRALDVVACLLSEFCGTSATLGQESASPTEAKPDCLAALSPDAEAVIASCSVENLPADQHDGDSSKDHPAAPQQQPVLVFRAPPVCRRKLPWRLLPLDLISRLPYAMQQLPRDQRASAGDPRLAQSNPPTQPQRSLIDPRVPPRDPAPVAAEPELAAPEAEQAASLKAARASRLQLNERSTAAAATASPVKSVPTVTSRPAFDPRFRRM